MKLGNSTICFLPIWSCYLTVALTNLLPILNCVMRKKAIALHSVLFKAAAELSQFRNGIYKVKGLQTMLKKYPKLLESFTVQH